MRTFFGFFCAFVGLVSIGYAQVAPWDAPAEPKGMKQIFNGMNLTDWEGDPRLWTVQDGCIRGETTLENPAQGNTFLIWKAGKLKDFELRLSFRCNATNNSGIQYRSTWITDASVRNPWVVRGYQFELRNQNVLPSVSGFIYDEGGGRKRLCLIGEHASIDGDGEKVVYKNFLNQEEYQKIMRIDAWNDVVIVAKGNELTHYLNGKWILTFIDNDEEKSKKEGVLALQLHAGKPMWAEFKDIRIREISNETSKNGK